jgi:hypothetical protein
VLALLFVPLSFKSHKKIVTLIHDDKPDVVNIALGNKDGDIYSSSEYELVKKPETIIVVIMEANFIS